MNESENMYHTLDDFWEKIHDEKSLDRKKFSKNLKTIAMLLDSAREKFERRQVPRREGHQLATTISLSSKLADQFKDQYRGLGAVFGDTLPNIGRLMRDADFFIDKKPRMELHPSFDRDDAEFPDYARSRIKEACHEMERAAGAISAYALEFEETK